MFKVQWKYRCEFARKVYRAFVKSIGVKRDWDPAGCNKKTSYLWMKERLCSCLTSKT